jgi:hypothetical protein
MPRGPAGYQPFKYEQLVDLTNYVDKGMWATSTDCTSGFHHLSLHPDMWEYAGFEYEGQYYVFTVPAFGLAPVPRIYTALMEEVYLRVREAGVPMTFMIDDQANWAKSEGQAKAQCSALVQLLATLGFYLRPDKCQLRPRQQVGPPRLRAQEHKHAGAQLGMLCTRLRPAPWTPWTCIPGSR